MKQKPLSDLSRDELQKLSSFWGYITRKCAQTILLMIAGFGFGSYLRAKIDSEKTETVNAGKLTEVIVTDQFGKPEKDTVFTVSLKASKNFREATMPLIQDGKMKVEKTPSIKL